jgi:hypothetical protein
MAHLPTTLSGLTLHGVSFGVKAFCTLPHIKKLELAGVEITPLHLQFFPRLETFKVRECSSLTTLEFLSPTVKVLRLGQLEPTGHLVETIPAHLTSLHTLCCKDLLDEDVKRIPPSITDLTLHNSKIRNVSVAFLPARLTLLSLGSPYLTEKGLSLIPPSVTMLQLLDTPKLSDISLSYIPSTVKTLLASHGHLSKAAVNAFNETRKSRH